MKISYTEMGLLYGLGFGVLYAIIGFPAGHLLDRGRRISIVVVGVILWSASTIASAFAPNYPILVICRAGVAIGEAVLTPAAISLIADVFPQNKRTLPTMLYTSVGNLMPAGAFIVGGAAVTLAGFMAPILSMDVWRVTLIIVGAPGIGLAAILALAVREPQRSRVLRSDGADLGPIRQAVAYLVKERRLWGFLAIAMSMVMTGAIAFVGWTSTLLVKAHGLTTAQAGYAFGTVGLISSVCGLMTWGYLASLGARRRRPDALLLLLGAGATIHLFAIAIVGLSGSIASALAAIGAAFFGMGAIAVVPNLIIQTVAPSQLRARLTAGNLASNMIGMVVGPPLVPFLAKHIFDGSEALGPALSLIATVLLPIVATAIYFARPAYIIAWKQAGGIPLTREKIGREVMVSGSDS